MCDDHTQQVQEDAVQRHLLTAEVDEGRVGEGFTHGQVALTGDEYQVIRGQGDGPPVQGLAVPRVADL